MRKRLTILLAASIGAVAAAGNEATAAEEPKLILAITICAATFRSGMRNGSAPAAFAT
jgi:hypothetical protein